MATATQQADTTGGISAAVPSSTFPSPFGVAGGLSTATVGPSLAGTGRTLSQDGTAATTITNTATSTSANSTATVQARPLRCTSTDDSYSDFNYWKIPPTLLEDEY